jgi:phosphate starvation-inducible PhoH-like protein
VLEDRTIEIAPLAYMRGRTLSDAFVILDEAQNATTAQMKMFLTRLGLNSKVVITGDKTQIDLPRRSDSGLLEVERILTGIDGIAFVYLDGTDVIRHRLVKDIIRAYARAEEAEESP